MKKQKTEEFDFFDIDKNILDEEWVNQPKMFFDYASQLADARKDFEEMKAALDVTSAELDKAIRESPEEFDLEGKTTETLIRNTIIQQKDYQDAQQDVINTQHKVNILQAAVTALDHRKSALERLVSLHGQNYFASPQATNDSAKTYKEEMTANRVKKAWKNKKKREAK